MEKRVKKVMAALVGVALISAAGAAQAETRFAVQDAAGTADKMVVTDTGNIGIGTSNPSMAIVVDKAGTTGETSMLFRNRGALPYNQFNSPAFFFMRNNDTSVNSGLPATGDRLGSISFGSLVPSYKYGANISSFAQGTWTATSFPGYLTFNTTGAANTSPLERMRIDPEGNIGVGTNSPTQKLEVKGGVRLNTTASAPACDSVNGANNRGTIWYTRGGAGAKDQLKICVKNASENYEWVTIY